MTPVVLAMNAFMLCVRIINQLLLASSALQLIQLAPNRFVMLDILLLHPMLSGDEVKADEAQQLQVDDELAADVLGYLVLVTTADASAVQSYPRLPLLARALVMLLRLNRNALPRGFVTCGATPSNLPAGTRMHGSRKESVMETALMIVNNLLTQERSHKLLLQAGALAALNALKKLPRLSLLTSELIRSSLRGASAEPKSLATPDVLDALEEKMAALAQLETTSADFDVKAGEAKALIDAAVALCSHESILSVVRDQGGKLAANGLELKRNWAMVRSSCAK